MCSGAARVYGGGEYALQTMVVHVLDYGGVNVCVIMVA